MNAVDIIRQLEGLDASEVAQVRLWLDSHADEPPELLAAIDAGLRSLESGLARDVSREELTEKVAAWAGVSR